MTSMSLAGALPVILCKHVDVHSPYKDFRKSSKSSVAVLDAALAACGFLRALEPSKASSAASAPWLGVACCACGTWRPEGGPEGVMPSRSSRSSKATGRLGVLAAVRSARAGGVLTAAAACGCLNGAALLVEGLWLEPAVLAGCAGRLGGLTLLGTAAGLGAGKAAALAGRWSALGPSAVDAGLPDLDGGWTGVAFSRPYSSESPSTDVEGRLCRQAMTAPMSSCRPCSARA